MNRPHLGLVGVLSLLLNVVASAQGPLDPPGSPSPSMKSLAEIEPRTAITSLPFTVTNPGSYYLTGSLTLLLTNQHGITIAANNVTIDLGGFALIGPGAGFRNAISQDVFNYSNATVRNGSAVNWGPAGQRAISLAGSAALVENIAVRQSSGGISVGLGSIVRNCRIENNVSDSILYGIVAATGSIVENCTVQNNQTLAGFLTGIQADVVRNCIVRDCISAATFTGITVGQGGRVEGCSVLSCEGATSTYGIYSQGASLIRDCVVTVIV
ncbi:MAG TPA: right-handed parallel beta-helix repeat-containing protein [Kiritimatiellia bacterium]|nr:right-handed parallel beta-helix repeat-containing protein [Kiritimatiellia bacterium]